jgi:proteasome alpha subunit
MGGQSDTLGAFLSERYTGSDADMHAVAKLGHDALKEVENRDMPAESLEVAVLDRTRPRRKFRRLVDDEVVAAL